MDKESLKQIGQLLDAKMAPMDARVTSLQKQMDAGFKLIGETMATKFDLEEMGEKLEAMDERLEGIDEKLDSHDYKITKMMGTILPDMHADIRKIDKRVAHLDERVGCLEDHLELKAAAA